MRIRWRMIGWVSCALVAEALGARMVLAAGLATLPLPKFSDGSSSVEVARFSGVVGRGSVETVVVCTSLAVSPVHVGLEIFDQNGTRLNNVNAGQGAVLNVSPRQTVTFGTSATAAYLETQVLPISVDVEQGSARVLATNANVFCAVMLMDDVLEPPTSLATLPPGVGPNTGTTVPGSSLPTFSNGTPATHSLLVAGLVKKDFLESDLLCTSLSALPIHVGVQVFSPSGVVQNNIASGQGAILNVPSGSTVTFGTTGTVALLESNVITLPSIDQGLARVVTNSPSLMCSGLVLDEALMPPRSFSSLPASGCRFGATPTACVSVTTSPSLPQFSDGSSSVLVMDVPGAVKRGAMETVVVCTSRASTAINIGVQIFDDQGALLNDVTAGNGALLAVASRQTVTFGTSGTAGYSEDELITIPGVEQGSARIISTSSAVDCAVMIADEVLSPPAALATFGPGVRPIAGSALPGVALPTFSNGTPATHSLLVGGAISRNTSETVIFCTSLATTPIHLGVELFDTSGALQNSVSTGDGAVLNVAPRGTVTFGTAGTAAFLENAIVSVSGVTQGVARVVGNSRAFMCSALTLDDAVSPPASVSNLPLLGCQLGAAPPQCPVCGNGTVEAGEACDDGNVVAGDCCSPVCAFEPNGPASCDGNVCTRSDSCTNGVCIPGGCASGSACSICGGTCALQGISCDCLY